MNNGVLNRLAKLYQLIVKEKDNSLRHTLRRIIDIFHNCASYDSTLKRKLCTKGCFDALIHEASNLPATLTLYLLKCVKLVISHSETIEFFERTKMLQELCLLLQNRTRSHLVVIQSTYNKLNLGTRSPHPPHPVYFHTHVKM